MIGSMILIACVILAVFPAGILFPQMAGRAPERQKKEPGAGGWHGKGANS